MYMYNNPSHASWAPNNGVMYHHPPYQHQGQPRPPVPYHHMMPPPYQAPHWQGPGPSRPRGWGNRRGGPRYGNRIINTRNDETCKDICCKCGEKLQNSEELGIHLCDGGNQVIINEDGLREEKEQANDVNEADLDERLERLLQNLKDFVRNKYQSVSQALEGYVSDKISEITTLHRENEEEKAALEKMKKEMEEKANQLLKQEKEIKDKQKRLSKDQDAFKREMKKEREEVCRQWQQLRDEISRMEEMHNIQKVVTLDLYEYGLAKAGIASMKGIGRIKLDVGGHVYTTSLLTLTRESDSMLAAMFSGRHEILKEEDGCVFIDRDGTHFRYVLNYLRDGGVNMDCLPRDRQMLKELKKEATYYQLHGLIQQIEKYL